LTVRVGVVLGSRSPAALVAWYRAVFGEGIDVVVEARDGLASECVEPQRFVINVLVEDAAAVEARLVAAGVVWVRELELGPCGPIGTVVDLDGNYVQFIEVRTEAGARTGPRGGDPPGRATGTGRRTRDGAGRSHPGGERSVGAGRRRRRRRRPDR